MIISNQIPLEIGTLIKSENIYDPILPKGYRGKIIRTATKEEWEKENDSAAIFDPNIDKYFYEVHFD